MINFLNKLKRFYFDFKNESRIPMRDKKILLGFLVASTLPVLIIPGWISTYGFFISLFLFSFIPDYLFNVLDSTLFLSTFPFDLKTYNHLKRSGEFIAQITPSFVSAQIFEYKKEVIR